eukprot:gene7500-8297_t
MEFEATTYEPATAVRLEQSVQHQLTSRTYDLNSNKTLLKNYLVNADLAKPEIVTNILVLALMRLPLSDFTILLNLLPPKLISHKSVNFISDSALLLEKGQYADFWEEYVSQQGQTVFSSASGFVENIRLFILGNLSQTYKAMPKTLFAQQLGLNDSSLEAFCSGNKFIAKIATENVYFAPREDNVKVAPTLSSTGALRTAEGLSILPILSRMH